MHCNWRLLCILSIVKQKRSEYASELYIEEHAGPVSWTWGCIIHTICHSLLFFQFTLTYRKSTLRLLIKFYNECITILYCVSNKKLITVNKNFYFK